MKYKSLFLLALVLMLNACDESMLEAFGFADESDEDYNYQSSDTSSSASAGSSRSQVCREGTSSPYGDIQVDSQCQVACMYLSSGQTEGVKTACEILKNWEQHADIRASSCGACRISGYTKSINSTWSLCVKESDSSSECSNKACSEGYTYHDTFASEKSCIEEKNSLKTYNSF